MRSRPMSVNSSTTAAVVEMAIPIPKSAGDIRRAMAMLRANGSKASLRCATARTEPEPKRRASTP